MDRTRTAITVLLAVLILLGSYDPAVAQPIERPTNCTETMSTGTIFVGHDCGEWASVLISGTLVIRKPWSRANRASRAVRLRERREGRVGVAPTATPTVAGPADPLDGPPPSGRGNGNRGGTTPGNLQIALRCEDTPEQTIITNAGDQPIVVTEIRSLVGPLVAGEEGIPTSQLAIPPDETRTVETGSDADTASGGISSEIYDNDRLDEEGARIITNSGESIEAPCAS